MGASRESCRRIPVAALGIPAAGLSLRQESLASSLTDPVGMERAHLVLPWCISVTTTLSTWRRNPLRGRRIPGSAELDARFSCSSTCIGHAKSRSPPRPRLVVSKTTRGGSAHNGDLLDGGYGHLGAIPGDSAVLANRDLATRLACVLRRCSRLPVWSSLSRAPRVRLSAAHWGLQLPTAVRHSSDPIVASSQMALQGPCWSP